MTEDLKHCTRWYLYGDFLIDLHSRVTFALHAKCHTVFAIFIQCKPTQSPQSDTRLLNLIRAPTVWYLQCAMQIYEWMQLNMWQQAFSVSPSDKLNFSRERREQTTIFEVRKNYFLALQSPATVSCPTVFVYLFSQQSITIWLVAFHGPKASEKSKPQVNVQHIQSTSHPVHPPIHPCLSGLCSL